MRNTTVVSSCYRAVYVEDGASLDVVNSIIVYGGLGVPVYGAGVVTTTHSCIFGNAGGDSLIGVHSDNIFVAPLFCDLSGGDVTLHDDSPCLPMGNPWGVLMGARGAGGCGTGTDGEGLFATALAVPTPNPFNPTTAVGFSLATGGHVTLRVHDAAGRVVRTLVDEHVGAGPHTVVWDGTNDAGQRAGSGVYFIRMEAEGQHTSYREARKLVLLK